MLMLLNRAMLNRLLIVISAVGVMFALLFLTEETAHAQSPSHAYINQTRSSMTTNYFVGIGVESEFGLLTSDKQSDEDEDKSKEKTQWQGYGIRNELGLEFLKFLQFSIGHTSLNVRSKKDGSESMSGSRFNGGAALAFYAPLGNLSFGGGFLGSRMDYRQQDQTTSYYGSGYYYDVGYNYFLNYNISFYLNGRRNLENLIRNSGSKEAGDLQTETSSVGAGFKIWL